MHHEDTTTTKVHEGRQWESKGYLGQPSKARADALSGEIIAAAIEVHRLLGPGLLEPVYEVCLSHELTLRGLEHQRQVSVPVSYKGVELGASHRVDLLVEDLVIVELKSVERLEPIHDSQLLTYLRLSGRWLGLVVNFNSDRIKHGVRRTLNG